MGTEENEAAQRRIIDEVMIKKDLDLADELFSEEISSIPNRPGSAAVPKG